MAFTKHLSTHMYFHMDRQPKKTPSVGSGFEPATRSKGDGAFTAFERLNRTLRAGLDPFQEQKELFAGSSDSGSGGGCGGAGRRIASRTAELQDLQEYPDQLSSSSRGKRRHQRRKGQDKYEVCSDEMDYFIIPAANIERFMPLQHHKERGGVGTIEMAEPKLCIVMDFGENTFTCQDLPSPVATPMGLAPKEWVVSQLVRQRKAFVWAREAHAASEGLLLMNVERHSQFPFVTYLVLNNDPRRLIAQLENQVVGIQSHDQIHHIAGYEEVATIARPPLDMVPARRPTNRKTGFIVSFFRVFPGEDREKLERSWLLWTGARQIYRRLPPELALRRVTFHKKCYPESGITYVLMCECAAMMDHVTVACGFVDQLRARCCGYTALYRTVDFF